VEMTREVRSALSHIPAIGYIPVGALSLSFASRKKTGTGIRALIVFEVSLMVMWNMEKRAEMVRRNKYLALTQQRVRIIKMYKGTQRSMQHSVNAIQQLSVSNRYEPE
jgi:hypothetical protein